MTCRSPSTILIEFGSNAKLTATRRSAAGTSSVTYPGVVVEDGSESRVPISAASGAAERSPRSDTLQDHAERSPDSNPRATSGAVLDYGRLAIPGGPAPAGLRPRRFGRSAVEAHGPQLGVRHLAACLAGVHATVHQEPQRRLIPCVPEIGMQAMPRRRAQHDVR